MANLIYSHARRSFYEQLLLPPRYELWYYDVATNSLRYYQAQGDRAPTGASVSLPRTRNAPRVISLLWPRGTPRLLSYTLRNRC